MQIIDGVFLILFMSIILFGMSMGSLFMLRMILQNIRDGSNKLKINKELPAHLPVVTLVHNGIPMNFLVDTGSNKSNLAGCSVSMIKPLKINDDNTMSIGGSVNTVIKKRVTLDLEDNDGHKFIVDFAVNDALDGPFDHIFKDKGVSLSGSLGMDFIETYGFVLDFSDVNDNVNVSNLNILKYLKK